MDKEKQPGIYLTMLDLLVFETNNSIANERRGFGGWIMHGSTRPMTRRKTVLCFTVDFSQKYREAKLVSPGFATLKSQELRRLAIPFHSAGHIMIRCASSRRVLSW